MEYSETALPTCYWVLYYYGDFSVAPSFVQTVEGRDKRIEQKERWLIQAKGGETVWANSADINWVQAKTFRQKAWEEHSLTTSHRAVKNHRLQTELQLNLTFIFIHSINREQFPLLTETKRSAQSSENDSNPREINNYPPENYKYFKPCCNQTCNTKWQSNNWTIRCCWKPPF